MWRWRFLRLTTVCSASPLNGEAALLWDRDQAEYKKKVLARHQEPKDMEDNGLPTGW